MTLHVFPFTQHPMIPAPPPIQYAKPYIPLESLFSIRNNNSQRLNDRNYTYYLGVPKSPGSRVYILLHIILCSQKYSDCLKGGEEWISLTGFSPIMGWSRNIPWGWLPIFYHTEPYRGWLASNDTSIPIVSCINKQMKGGWLLLY